MSETEHLPDGWRRIRLRYLLDSPPSGNEIREIGGEGEVSFFPMEAIGEDGSLDASETRDYDAVSSGYTRFLEGDVVVAKITPCFENGKGALIEGTQTGVGFGTTELHALRPSSRIAGRFLWYVTADPRFRALGERSMIGAAGQKRVPQSFVSDYVVALPPLAEQRAIAADLDRETARLDALVAAKTRLVARLGDKRRAVVAQAVTRGMDPDASMRDAGVPWLGEVPARWEARRLATLFEEIDQRGEPDLPLLVVSINTGVSLREFSDDRIERVAADFESYKVVRAGEFAFNKMRMWQGAVGVAPKDGLISPDYVVARPTVPLDVDYFEALFRSPMMSAEFARHSHGIVWDRLRLYWPGFRSVRVPYPPLDEQRAIVAEIQTQTSKIDAVVRATEQSIGLLRDRRAALIAATVTGRRRVLQPA